MFTKKATKQIMLTYYCIKQIAPLTTLRELILTETKFGGIGGFFKKHKKRKKEFQDF